jgi:hypothetical protein
MGMKSRTVHAWAMNKQEEKKEGKMEEGNGRESIGVVNEVQ